MTADLNKAIGEVTAQRDDLASRIAEENKESEYINGYECGVHPDWAACSTSDAGNTCSAPWLAAFAPATYPSGSSPSSPLQKAAPVWALPGRSKRVVESWEAKLLAAHDREPLPGWVSDGLMEVALDRARYCRLIGIPDVRAMDVALEEAEEAEEFGWKLPDGHLSKQGSADAVSTALSDAPTVKSGSIRSSSTPSPRLSTGKSRSRVPTFEELEEMEEFKSPGFGASAPRPAVPVPRPALKPPKALPDAVAAAAANGAFDDDEDEDETEGRDMDNVLRDFSSGAHNSADVYKPGEITAEASSGFPSAFDEPSDEFGEFESASAEEDSTASFATATGSLSSSILGSPLVQTTNAADLDIFGLSSLPSSSTTTSQTTLPGPSNPPKDLNAEILASLARMNEASNPSNSGGPGR